MNLIICTDLNGGINFNNRRLSSDILLTKYLSSNFPKLYIEEYSYSLFQKVGNTSVTIISNPKDVPDNQWLFAETDRFFYPLPEKLCLVNWNRVYPKDKSLPTSFLDNYNLISTEEIQGNSHDTITITHYERTDIY